jgi:SAM-dependent methyltransferase
MPCSPTSFEFLTLRLATNYRAAVLREFAGHLRGRVLEIGAGVGQITSLLRRQPGVNAVVAVEPEGDFCAELRRSWPPQLIVQGTSAAIHSNSHWDALVSINVLEHVQADEDELRRYHCLLRASEGALCLFVPARPEIYAPIDRDFGHYRRYTRAELQVKLRQAGFQVVRLHYFNLAGYFAWWLNFCVLRQRHFEAVAVRLFDRVIFPPMNAVETRLCRPPLGQSLVAVGRPV